MSHFDDLYLFMTVVQAGSFTKAGEQLGVSKSALSQSISQLENRLNIRLLNRTTRSLSPTPEGLSLYNDIAPHFSAIRLGLDKLADQQMNVAGTVRINASLVAIEMVILPKLAPILNDFPHICVELHSDNRLVDIVKEGFDLGVRLGNAVAADMVAVKISPPLKMALVATPTYLNAHGTPRQLADLDQHRLIGIRFSPDQPPLAWDFSQGGQRIEYTPKSQLLMNSDPLGAVQHHLGIGWQARPLVADKLERGELVEVLSEFAYEYPPLYAYYPSRKHHSKAFEMVLKALKA